GTWQAGDRSPECVKGEGAERALELFRQPLRRAIDAKDLVAVGAIVRLGRDANLDVGPLVKPPEELGAAELPAAAGGAPAGSPVERLSLEQPVGLLPEADLASVAVEPAVADDTVAPGALPGQQRCLRRAGDGWHDVAQRAHPALVGQGAQP